MRIKITALIILGTLVISACGADKGSPEDLVSENTDQVQKIMTPMNFGEFEPIPADLLLETWKAWEGKTVQVSGYLDLFFEKGALSFKSTGLTEKPGDKKKLVAVDLSEKDETEYTRNVPVTIEGKLKGIWGFNGDYSAKLVDAKIIQNDVKIPEGTEINPNDLTTPVSAKALYENYVGWLGKEITVEGNANGVTTSTTANGVTIRVDLTEPGSAFNKYCGVRVIDESQAQSAKDNPNKTRKYRGVFAGDCFNQVCIEEAVEVK